MAKVGRHRKVGRPKGSKSRIECVTRSVYRKRKGRIVKVTGKNKRSCVKK